MRHQGERYGAEVVSGTIDRLHGREGEFLASLQDGSRHKAERVLLATGTIDTSPPLALPNLQEAVQHGLVRFCPICDAYEVIGRKLALISSRRCRIHEALLLRGYTTDLTLLTLQEPWELPDEERSRLTQAGISIIESPARELQIEGNGLVASTADGEQHQFDSLYVALGLRARSDLATSLGAEHDAEGALVVDAHQQTTVPGLYAAGDVVQGLAQISVAMGHAAIAATAIHNDLPLRPAQQ